MSGPVDVLAVLDDLAADMGDTPGTAGHQVAQVSAAVAELIRCGDGLLVSLDLKHPAVVVNNWRKSLRAALAGAGGAP